MREPKRKHVRRARKLNRPVEWDALKSVQAWISANPHRRPASILNQLEAEVLIYERYFLDHYQQNRFVQQHGYLGIHDRWRWIGKQLGLGERQVRAILYEVDKVLNEYHNLSWWERINDREWAALCRGILQELGQETRVKRAV